MATFPFLSYPTAPLPEPPLFKEWAYDFQNEHMIVGPDGTTTILTGLEALKVWIYKAIRTEKARYRAYSGKFGSEVDTLIGSTYSPAAAQAEAQRMITEALLQSRYIKSVEYVTVSFSEDDLDISCKLSTVYGTVDVDRVL